MQPRVDGARPKNAACMKCGYVFGGIEIRGRIVVCPECGVPNEFTLPALQRESRAWQLAKRALWLLAAASFITVALGAARLTFFTWSGR